VNEFERTRRVLQQMRAVLPVAEPHERPAIRQMIFSQQLKLALLLEQRRLEAAIDGGFDPMISRKLEAIQVLLGGE
jgi:hypothetical protein